jgi:flagellar basal-body rod protein FlgF
MRCSLRRSMIQGIYQSAAAADALQTWNDVIARNLAGASNPGFKKDAVDFDGVISGMLSYGPEGSKSTEQAAFAPLLRAGINFQPGEMNRTGDPQEFAIEGGGFFRLQRPDGEYVYTRDGQFRIGPDGRLESKQGFPVMGDSGPIQLLIEGGPMSVDAEGRVRQGDQEIGVLAAYDVPDHRALQRTIGGFVVDPTQAQNAQRVENARIRQGYLEMSNVSAMHEMSDMIIVSNALQANQRVLQSYDGLLDRAVQVLGSTSS